MIRVQPSFSARLAEAARASGTTKSDFMRQAAEREIAASPLRPKPETRP